MNCASKGALVAAALGLVACGDDTGVGGRPDAAPAVSPDAGPGPDAGPEPDATPAPDGAPPACTPQAVAVCARSADGLECGTSNGTDGFADTTLASADFSDEAMWDESDAYWSTIQVGDIDGDGVDDVCGRAADGIECALGDGDGGFADSALWTTLYNDEDGWVDSGAYFGTIQLADLDGDGADDVCGRSSVGLFCGLSNGADGFESFDTWAPELDDDSGWFARDQWSTLQLVDVTGDGAADVCGNDADGIVCGPSNGTDAFSPLEPWTEDFSAEDGWDLLEHAGTIRFPDLDGDGDADVCGRDVDGIRCALSAGDSFEASSLWLERFTDEDGFTAPEAWGTIQFPDLDGDGDADICARESDGLTCALSNGADGFEGADVWNGRFGDDSGWDATPAYWATIQFPDLDGDGDADVCGRGASELVCALSNGTDAFDEMGDPVWSEDFTDEAGFDAQSSYRTMRFPVARAGDCDTDNASYAVPWVTSGVPPRIPAD